MKIYLYDPQTYFYIGEGEATPGDVPNSWTYPNNATPTPTPDDIPAGKTARWNGMVWELADSPTPSELRQEAYVAEADQYLTTHQHYQAEADAWDGLEDTDGYDRDASTDARTKAAEALTAYLDKKLEIRERYPDAVAVHEEEVEAEDETEVEK